MTTAILETESAVQRYLAAVASGAHADELRPGDGGQVVGRFLWCEMASAFQSVVALDGKSTVCALQALARLAGNPASDRSPWGLFEVAATDADLVQLDRRARLVHTLNFFAAGACDLDLHLCVHARLLSAVPTDHGRAFGRVLDSLELPPRRIVIVLPTLPAGAERLLAQVLASYRQHGFRVATTPGSLAQLDALTARLPADLVRIDQRLLDGAASDSAPVLARARAAGSQVLVKRIETAAQLAFARQAGATHAQGYYLGRPGPLAPTLAPHAA